MRRTIQATKNPSVVGAAVTRNNGRYNGNGREWSTPPEVFDPLDSEFQFTIDVCASPWNYKVPRYYTELFNGLERSWEGERVWMNPPYGREVYAWTRKAREEAHHATIVGLLPASTDLAWWHEDVLAVGAEVRYLRGRVRFLTGGPYPRQRVLRVGDCRMGATVIVAAWSGRQISLGFIVRANVLFSFLR